ncbi:PorT family protein [Carboxylicivirga mesophila]|uniref:PorT family protein n=1 Tax=Carboxylicivirga mesophila TaxID=1166478 RepID=A0ABS5KFN4_9BACT|nr:outer membrane beta-barrel protein [Carboxylicivirga mesophila]MBS2213602.1 PorT family protein [Carboxylicivirga mesophila]
MRKKRMSLVISFIGLMSFISFAYSQVTIKPGIGINITNWSKDPGGATTSGNVGWQIGGTVAFGEKLFFEPGLFYVEQSTEVDVIDSELPDNFKFDNKITSLRIPVNVGYSILGKEDGMFSLHVFGGPTASFVLDVKETELLSKDDHKSVNWGVQAGAGINLTMFYLDASYEWGLNEFLEDMDEKVKLQGFYLTAGIKF